MPNTVILDTLNLKCFLSRKKTAYISQCFVHFITPIGKNSYLTLSGAGMIYYLLALEKEKGIVIFISRPNEPVD